VRSRLGNLSSLLRTKAALCLAVLLPVQSLVAQVLPYATDGKAGIPRVDTSRAQVDPRVLHLLNRFTFGATPEEIAAIRSMGNHGLERWFEGQLRPNDLPATRGDVELETQLTAMPSMSLPVDQLIGTFPSKGVIRQAADGKIPMPQDANLNAIYRHHIELYKGKQEKKAEMPAGTAAAAAKPEAVAPTGAVMNGAATTVAATDTARPSYDDLLVKGVLALKPEERVGRILRMSVPEYEAFRSGINGPKKMELLKGLTPQDREMVGDFENPTKTVVDELEAQRLLRDIYSSHQLQEVMTTFWLNHFNIFIHKNDEMPYYMASFERDVIAPNALGNFEDLLVATAESPAMLLYLDNSSNTGPKSDAAEAQRRHDARVHAKQDGIERGGLNENYARELMELHTLGVNGGYTQADVTEVAKIFSGWTVDRPQLGGDFKYDDARHEPGTKTVMGHKIKEGAGKEGLKLLHMLATSSATAHFISQELAVAFVSDTPPAALVDRMAKSFLKNDGEIAEVLRTMVHAPEFWSAETYQAKVKTPLEYVVSSVRASDAEITNVQPLVNALNQMGMPLYRCVPPSGYSLKADAWVSTGELVNRMNFALTLTSNRFPGILTQWDVPAVTGGGQAALPMFEQSLETRLVPSGVSEKTRAATLEQSEPPATQAQQKIADDPKAGQKGLAQAAQQERRRAQIAGLLLGSPEFQKR
jgi:hypothetical protein